MNDQPTILGSTLPPLPAPHKPTNISLILIIILGIGTIGFGLASILAFGKAHTATATLNSSTANAARSAANTQKEADDKAAIVANESPYRTYTAPEAFGAFAISFPKNWNLTVDLEDNDQSQVDMQLHPDMVRTVNNKIDLLATRVTLVREQMSDYLARFTSNKKISQTPVTVSGIAGMKLTGTFPDARTTTMIVVPVRDKSLVFTNEDTTYAAEFQTILAQAKINP